MNHAEERDLAVLKELAQRNITMQITIDWMDVWHIVSTMQLVCRHPDISPAHRKEIKRVAKQLQQALAAIDPRLDRILEKGWHSAYDVKKD